MHNNWGTSTHGAGASGARLRLHIDADSLRVYPLSTIGGTGVLFVVEPISPGYFELVIDQEVYPTLWFYRMPPGGLVPVKDASGTYCCPPLPRTRWRIPAWHRIPTGGRSGGGTEIVLTPKEGGGTGRRRAGKGRAFTELR